LAWRIEIESGARKDIAGLDRPIVIRVFSFLREKLGTRDDPRSIGEALHGKVYGEYWKYRVGDIRIIARIEDAKFIVLVVRAGQQKNVYK
jgi:mRNA interferase RelE/StbE